MARNITDRALLNSIYDTYYDAFFCVQEDDKNPNYIPVDCELIGKNTGLNKNLVFGRLYYHLNKVHGYKNDDDSLVSLFAKKVGVKNNAINYPLLASVVADMNSRHYVSMIPIAVSVVALVISFISIFK